jgi:hypothetical protein
MFPDIAAALKNHDYDGAARLLAGLSGPEKDDNPWVELYQAQLLEGLGEIDQARSAYRHLLGQVTHPKLLTQIRQALARCQDQQRQELEAQKPPDPVPPVLPPPPQLEQELAIFVLDCVAAEAKAAIAIKLGQIMKIDAYSARLQLPSRSWRIYRTGPLEELKHYQQQFQEAGIPSFCVPLARVLSLSILPVFHLETLSPQAQVSYRLDREHRGTFDFVWSEVAQRVEGMLPIFEECVHLDRQGKIERKTQILDYAKVCDLHLPAQNLLLRFCDQTYEYDWGVPLLGPQTKREQEGTNFEQWGRLRQLFQEYCPQAIVWSEFQPFAETALDFSELLKTLEPHRHFMRREETLWDQAFHLYSGLALCRYRDNPTVNSRAENTSDL